MIVQLFPVQQDHCCKDQGNPQSGEQGQRFGKKQNPDKRRHQRLNCCKDSRFAGLNGTQAEGLSQEGDHGSDKAGQPAEKQQPGEVFRGGKL